jgi:4-hydroxybenzoate polyprenyltransferase
VAHAQRLWIAAGGFPGWHLLAVFTLGTILMRSAGCCVNDVADREFDRHVKRTASGRSPAAQSRCPRRWCWVRCWRWLRSGWC